MKKKLHLIILGVIAMYAALFIAIGLITVFLPSAVYDNQKLLANGQSSANKMNYRLSRYDEVTTITCGKMQGMEIIWNHNVDEDITRQMYYNLNVTSGKAKLILIQPDHTIITLVEQDGTVGEETVSTEESMVTLDLKKGKSRIKIVCGKDTSFSLSFRIPE